MNLAVFVLTWFALRRKSPVIPVQVDWVLVPGLLRHQDELVSRVFHINHVGFDLFSAQLGHLDRRFLFR